MRKVRSHAPAPGGAAISEDSASKCATEGPRALKQDLGAQQAASSNHQGESDLKSKLRLLVQSCNSQPYTDTLHIFLQLAPTEQERRPQRIAPHANVHFADSVSRIQRTRIHSCSWLQYAARTSYSYADG